MTLLVNESTRFQNNSTDRPMMLKDFLRDDYYQCSCTSCKSTASSKSNKPPPAVVLLRSWSKKAAATKVSAVQKVVNAVKFLHFVKSPLTILPRSNSRKNSKDKNVILGDHVMPADGKVKVKVKDILRWRSFRDTVEDESTPLDYPSSPNRTTTTTSCSKRSSWCDSDFTADEELPFWLGENEEGILGKKSFLDTNAALLKKNNTKGGWTIDECEQQSPVSVFDSPFQEVTISPFHPIVSNFESDTKSKHTRKHRFRDEIAICEGMNATEEKANQLLSHVKEDSHKQQVNNDHISMIYDFFVHELSVVGKLPDVEFDNKILSMAKSWINGQYDESYEWEVENRRDAYVKDMENEVSWNNFKQEQEEMSIGMEIMVLNELIDEALVDFLTG